MPGLSGPSETETVRLRDGSESVAASVGAPGQNDERCPPQGSSDVTPVTGADRVGHRPEGAWIGRAVGVEVHDLDPAVAPAPREADAAPDRGIVVPRIGSRWVQHDERDDGPHGVPSAPQPIAVAAIAAEGRAAGHPRKLRAVCSKSSVDSRSDSWSIRSLFPWNIFAKSLNEIRSLIRP